MLTLRQDWQSVTSGAVAIHLAGQPQTIRLRDEVASRVTAASLDLLVGTWPRKVQPPLVVESVSKSIWRISGMYYIYLRANDDNTLASCIKLSRMGTATVIVPRHHERLKRRLVTATVRGRTPCIWSFGSFVSYRTLFATADQAWPPKRAILELLKLYNRRVNADGCGDVLSVQIPQDLP